MQTVARCVAGIVALGYARDERRRVEAFVVQFVSDAIDDQRWRWWHLPQVIVWLLLDLWRDRAAARRPPASTIVHTNSRRFTMEQIIQDVRFGVRACARAPLFSLLAIVTLALGIGTATTVFAVVDGSILRPFPYPDLPRIVRLNERSSRNSVMSVAYLNFLDWKAQHKAFDELGLYRSGSATLSDGGPAERVGTATVSASVFETLGIAPLAGRRFVEADDAQTTAIALISERVWRSRFAASPSAVGATVTINGRSHVVVGVMPASLRFPSRLTDVWLPFGTIAPSLPIGRDNHPGLFAIGRLRKDVTLEQAQEDMRTIANRLAAAYPLTNGGNTVDVTPLLDTLIGSARTALLAFLGASALVLLIACANLINMLLGRAEGRQQEMAVRAALGASRTRLMQQWLCEAAVLVVAGAVAGVALSYWLVAAFVASQPSTVPRLDLIGVDGRTLAFAALIAALTTAVIGLMPAIRSSRAAVRHDLGDGRRLTQGRTRLRSALIVAEVALAFMLLVGAGLLARSFSTLMSRDLGFEPTQAISMRFGLPDVRYPGIDSWTAFHTNVLEQLTALPNAKAVGISAALPLEGVLESTVMREGDAPPPAGPQTLGGIQAISGSYFDALGSRVIAGRTFNPRDSSGAMPVAIIDDAGARRLFPGENAIGKRIAFESRTEPPAAIEPIWREIVGVVPHVAQYGLTDEPDYPQVFVPYTQLPSYMRERRPAMAIVARGRNGQPISAVDIRRAIASLDAGIPVFGVQPLSSLVAEANEQQRIGRMVFVGVSSLALTLALLGIYGVLSYAVTQRRREIGVRIALGANGGTIVAMIGRQVGALVALGVALGAIGAIWLGRYITSLLVGVTANNPVVIAGAALLLICASMAAAAVPARRAANVDPVTALKGD